MLSCTLSIPIADFNGKKSTFSSALPFRPRLWRPLRSPQFTVAELICGNARKSRFFCNPIYAGLNNYVASLSKSKEEFLTSADIENAALRQGLTLQMDTVGPFFRVRVLDLQSKEVLGVAQGVVKLWTSGRILHLDSVRLSPLSLKAKKPVFGIAFFLGAAAVRYGYDQKCGKAELLAINDTDVYHFKLVRYYLRMGFKTVYHVTGERLDDIPHMLIWGGVGTRMDASIEELLLKWSPAFKKSSK